MATAPGHASRRLRTPGFESYCDFPLLAVVAASELQGENSAGGAIDGIRKIIDRMKTLPVCAPQEIADEK